MPTKCVKIRLRTGSRDTVEAWQEKLNSRRNDVIETLKAEGVNLEAVFLDQQSDGDYLIYVMNSADFDRVSSVATHSKAEIDIFHRAFKKDCWEERLILRPLIDFEIGSGLAQS